MQRGFDVRVQLGAKPVNGKRVDSAILSGPGAVPTYSDTVTGGGLCRSPSTLPEAASSTSAASSTVRASTPFTVIPLNASGNGQVEMRPRCGLMPTRCVHVAGMRMLPAPSEPIAAATRPAATAAALPPDDPPGVCLRDHGFLVCPNAGPLVKGHCPSSQVLVLPTITAPAALSRRTTSESCTAGLTSPDVPKAVRTPAMSTSSFTAIGTPSSGAWSPAARRRSASAASASADSVSTTRKAFSVDWLMSMAVQRAADQLVRRHLAAGQLVELVGQGREAKVRRVRHR
jgi:hypothetical protein